MIRLTCITTVFNAIAAGNESSLCSCLASVASLSTEHEHLVYDGGSTDGTRELLQKLAHEYDRMKVVSERDTGIYNAMNKGVRDARGEWLYVMGCDDCITHPEVLDALIGSLTREDVVVSPVENDAGYRPFDARKDIWKVLWSTPYCHQGVLMRTEVVRQFGGFDERYRLCADYNLMLKCHLAGCRIRYVRQPYAKFGLGNTGSMDDSAFDHDRRGILSEQLGLSPEAVAEAMRADALPVGVATRYLLHCDWGVRVSAREMMKRRLIGFLRKAKHAVGRARVYD